MNLGMGLSIEQSQKLVMTPELRQAIALLQYNVLELRDFVAAELQENPVLEVEEPRDISPEDGLERPVADWREYFRQGREADYDGRGGEEWGDDYAAKLPVKGTTLQEHALFQLHMAKAPPACKAIVRPLIENLLDTGYLAISLEEAAQWLGVSLGEAEEALALLQSFDPPGIGARNLVECLLLQVRARGLDNPLLERLIADHLEDLAAGRIGRIGQALGLTPGQVQELADLIRTLDPKPGLAFDSGEGAPPVIPDASLEQVDGEWVILVTDSILPRIFISERYRRLMREADGEVRRYLDEKLNRAAWLLKSIEQRRNTLYRVVESLLELQRDFFEQGVGGLRPMTLRQVAERIGVHESTVSRIVNNKYLRTPRGTYEMKFFFTSGVENAAGGKSSSAAIKERIRRLVAGEDPRNPLSDQDLADRLAQEGHNISRRTVAKYRDELQILSTKQRKRH